MPETSLPGIAAGSSGGASTLTTSQQPSEDYKEAIALLQFSVL